MSAHFITTYKTRLIKNHFYPSVREAEHSEQNKLTEYSCLVSFKRVSFQITCLVRLHGQSFGPLSIHRMKKRFLMIIEIKIKTIVIMTIHLLIIIRVAMKIIFNLILNLLLLSLWVLYDSCSAVESFSKLWGYRRIYVFRFCRFDFGLSLRSEQRSVLGSFLKQRMVSHITLLNSGIFHVLIGGQKTKWSSSSVVDWWCW